MLTEDQYNKLLQYRAALKIVNEGGSAPHLPFDLFNSIRGSLGMMQCNTCCNDARIECCKDMFNLMLEYEMDCNSKKYIITTIECSICNKPFLSSHMYYGDRCIGCDIKIHEINANKLTE